MFLVFIPIVNLIYTIIAGIKANHEIEKLVLKLQNEKYEFTTSEKEYYTKISRKISYLLFAGHIKLEEISYIKTIMRLFEEDINKFKYNKTSSSIMNTIEFENMNIDMELDYLFDRKSISTKNPHKVLKRILKK